MLKGLVSKKANNQLEAYIRNEDKAWAEDSDGETRVIWKTWKDLILFELNEDERIDHWFPMVFSFKKWSRVGNYYIYDEKNTFEDKFSQKVIVMVLLKM